MEQKGEGLQIRAGDAENDAKSRKTTLTIAYVPNVHTGQFNVPMLRIKGLWLKELGWQIGERVIVEADQDTIQILKMTGMEDSPMEASQAA